ncbi:MmgE/PrpD family protein [Candidatus Manganitrophus noduliformans]|uniref:MmgE/PrpD family protein n=1 Tax=Candidatus Manganitrophus noduliformans TaxID=2606439 RepID=A0A7X6IBT0_9BACT|nr:MmgE/PrpD family protein [Candidatus Manganitrophus noduliformans]NKE71948.1 MmgE/PrpD family protein [Candidatus Manganitrophus noduliformans]
MTLVEQLASFVVNASYENLSDAARQALKIRILDSIGCAIGALDGEPIRLIRAHLEDFGGAERCTLVGGGRNAPDRAAFYNSALVRYLDFNDSYLAKGETCHPSDNLGSVLAAAEYSDRSGKDLLAALAVAYQVQCRLSDVAPVRDKGFDHTTQGSYAAAAGVARALGLDPTRTAHAVAVSGTAFNALRVTRTGLLSHWKGLAYPNTAFGATHAAFLAMRGITGPLEVFEGNKGFMESIAGRFEIDWSREDLERVTRTIIKKYNAEIHSQSAIEGILELKREDPFSPADVERIEIEIFDVAHKIIGGGEEGDKTVVQNKEQADHSLQYMMAVALLDDQVLPEQYLPERIERQDVQALLQKITVRPRKDFSERFPDEMPCRLTVSLRDGRTLIKEKRDYEGFYTRPMQWETVSRKFEQLSKRYADASLRRDIREAVSRIEEIQSRDLMRLLSRVQFSTDLKAAS